MRPILFEIFGWEVPSWHFFFVLAACVAFLVARFCAGQAQKNTPTIANHFLEKLPNIFIICYGAGWFGARALSIFIEQLDVQGVSAFVAALFQIGPMTFYGGALAAVFCGLLYCHWSRVSLPFALDCGMLGGVVALGIGRVGCHLNGDDYGLPVADQLNPPWWSVRFPLLEDGGVYRYPVQLEETFASFFIFAVGWVLFRRSYALRQTTILPSPSTHLRITSGQTAAWVALLSAIHRYFNEIFRGDPRGFFPGTQISSSSGIALVIVIVCAVCLLRIRLRSPIHSPAEEVS